MDEPRRYCVATWRLGASWRFDSGHLSSFLPSDGDEFANDVRIDVGDVHVDEQIGSPLVFATGLVAVGPDSAAVAEIGEAVGAELGALARAARAAGRTVVGNLAILDQDRPGEEGADTTAVALTTVATVAAVILEVQAADLPPIAGPPLTLILSFLPNPWAASAGSSRSRR
jgi:hypothetical protein